MSEETLTKILQMKEYLLSRGIPHEEAQRAAMAYYEEQEPISDWPPKVTGLDLMPQINSLVPDTGSPPYFQPNTLGTTEPYPTNPTPDPLGSVKTNDPIYSLNGSNIGHTFNIANTQYQGDDTNWIGTANNLASQPPTLGVEPWTTQATQPWRYDIEDSQMQPLDLPAISIQPSGQFNEVEPSYMEYIYQNHDQDDVCYDFAGKIFDMNNVANRPVPPSEGLGYSTTHPNCICYWKSTGEIKADSLTPTALADIQTVHRKIGAKSHYGSLHKIKPDGGMSQRTGHRNYYRKPLKMIREALAQVRQEFGWLTEDYLERSKAMAQESGGVIYLVRASQEAITDHRAEGEQYRRLLAASELMAMSRTAIGHGMDINHNPEWRTGATILDSEFDPYTKSIQMLIMETDPEINQLIANGQITAVSINGGSPRSETVGPCDGSCNDGSCEICVIPRGVILGELDDIGLTWVVTDPRGIVWHGNLIPHAEPGVKTTIIQPV